MGIGDGAESPRAHGYCQARDDPQETTGEGPLITRVKQATLRRRSHATAFVGTTLRGPRTDCKPRPQTPTGVSRLSTDAGRADALDGHEVVAEMLAGLEVRGRAASYGRRRTRGCDDGRDGRRLIVLSDHRHSSTVAAMRRRRTIRAVWPQTGAPSPQCRVLAVASVPVAEPETPAADEHRACASDGRSRSHVARSGSLPGCSIHALEHTAQSAGTTRGCRISHRARRCAVK